MIRAETLLAALDALPLAPRAAITADARALIIAPHPDDETLGCGGLIAQLCDAGIPPIVVIMTDGAASHPHSRTHPPHRLAALRRAEARSAARLLGLPEANLIHLGHPDANLTEDSSMIEHVISLIRTHRCGVLFAPMVTDPHCDHSAAARIARSAATRTSTLLRYYPIWTWLLSPDTRLDHSIPIGWRLDISAETPIKQRAIAAHASQLGALITDSPTAFCLPPALLAIFARPFETFIEG